MAVFGNLAEKLQETFKRLSNKGKLSEADVKAAMREVRIALLEADVSYKVVKDFIAKVTERAVGGNVLESLNPELKDSAEVYSIPVSGQYMHLVSIQNRNAHRGDNDISLYCVAAADRGRVRRAFSWHGTVHVPV